MSQEPEPSPWAVPGSTPGPAPSPEPPVYQPPPPAQLMPGQVLPPSAVQPGYGSNGQPSYGGPAYPMPSYGPPPGYGQYGGPPVPFPPAPQPRFAAPPPRPAPPNPNAIRVDAIEGTSFGVAYPAIPPIPNGAAITSLVAGILSILVAFTVGCFGLTGAKGGWGPTVSGAFALLSAFVGAGAIFIGVRALRVIRASRGAAAGRGMAIAGISCGGSGVGLTVLFFLLAVLAVV